MVPHWAVVAATSSLGPAQTAPAIPNSTSSSNTTGDRWRFITGPPPSRVLVYRLAPRELLRDSFRDASRRRRRTQKLTDRRPCSASELFDDVLSGGSAERRVRHCLCPRSK